MPFTPFELKTHDNSASAPKSRTRVFLEQGAPVSSMAFHTQRGPLTALKTLLAMKVHHTTRVAVLLLVMIIWEGLVLPPAYHAHPY